jgi:hypothetical protein
MFAIARQKLGDIPPFSDLSNNLLWDTTQKANS